MAAAQAKVRIAQAAAARNLAADTLRGIAPFPPSLSRFALSYSPTILAGLLDCLRGLRYSQQSVGGGFSYTYSFYNSYEIPPNTRCTKS